jgi:cytochrome c oxidase subunit 2
MGWAMGTAIRDAGRRTGTMGVVALAGIVASAAAAWADQPRPWELGMQESATPVHEHLAWLHDIIVLPIITVITIFVMALLAYVMVKFHHTRHPVPTRITHYPVIEILWTVVPVLILVAIAIPSFKLMYYMDEVPKASMTINVTGHQWYWSYAYPDEKISFDSNIVDDKDLKPGQPRLLTVDNPLVVPAGTNVRVIISSTDVIHSWFMASFAVQEYAVIGRANESWFNVTKPGTYYGECNQICGINHSHMPIEVIALAKPDYDKWLAGAKTKFAVATPPVAPLGSAKPTQIAATGDRSAGN